MNGWYVLIGLLVVVAALVAWFITYYNRIRILSNRIEEAWAQIDVQLQKRFDLVPNLVETVKGYASHERDIFEKIAEARAGMVTGSREDRVAASDALTGVLGRLFAVAEAYPDLKASENFRLLQEQLEGIESKIAYARQFYNSSVLQFNNLITTIPGVWFAGGREKHPFLEAPEEAREAPKVEF
ncbi:MAG: LemA family protein [Candidatus Bathyarchaeota archaeon]|jgi:LemA protein|nr:LemA family protein [Candidatus Bathyarchaeota archaeon]